MYKEMIIVVIVIIIIVTLDIITNNYTTYATDTLSGELNNLKEYIILEDDEKTSKIIEEVKDKWKEYNKILSYYIEHDELEKVETELATLSGIIEAKDYNHGIGNLNATVFILEHIKDKEKFSIQNIF